MKYFVSKFIFCCILLILLTGCASLESKANRSKNVGRKLIIYTDPGNADIVIYDKTGKIVAQTCSNDFINDNWVAAVNLEGKSPFLVEISHENYSTETIEIKRKFNHWYWGNIPLTFAFGIGWVGFVYDPVKGYTVLLEPNPAIVYLQKTPDYFAQINEEERQKAEDAEAERLKDLEEKKMAVQARQKTQNLWYIPETNKGDMHIRLSIPYVNSFFFVPENEGNKINTGFHGIALGFDYYHSKNQFVNFGVSGVMDFFFPILTGFSYDEEDGDEFKSMYSVYFFLSNNHKINRFTFGYGFSYAMNFWNYAYHNYSNTPDLPPSYFINKSHWALGLYFPNYLFINKYFGLGVIYRPTFFRPNLNEKFRYEHLVSIELPLKIPFYNAKKKKFWM
ncbi:MAG: hypothetical protein LBH44_00840 [Treponema sp.]|jgi:hypothetical protein|nr:hypothetical protein [Treponema sp.]